MKFKRFLLTLLIFLTSCLPSSRQKASEDCLFAKEAEVKAAACAYTDSLHGVEEIDTKIQQKETRIEKLQAEIEVLKLDKKAAEKTAELLKKEWEASGQLPEEKTPTTAPTQGGGN